MPTPTEELIAKYTVSGSSTTTYTFSSIPNNYTDLILVGSVATIASTDVVNVRTNTDTATNYSRTFIYGDGSAAYSSRTTSDTTTGIATLDTTLTPIVLNFMNYSNTTTYKTWLYRGGKLYPAAQAALWRSTAAINSITVYFSSQTFVAGTTFSLYGVL